MSYAGHYIPAICALLLKQGDESRTGVSLRGAIMVSPWTDALLQMAHDAWFLYENDIFGAIQLIRYTIEMWICRVAAAVSPRYGYTICAQVEDATEDASGVKNIYNIKLKEDYVWEKKGLIGLFNRSDVRAQLGVSDRYFTVVNGSVREHLRWVDYYLPYTDYVAYILTRKLPTLVLFGKLDLACDWRGGVHMIESADWDGRNGFNEEARWEDVIMNGTRYAEQKVWKNLRLVVVLEAGHLVERDQPVLSEKLITEFIRETS